MKKTIISLLILALINTNLLSQTRTKSLLIIDIQDFYFPGGSSALVDPEIAAKNAALLLADFRREKLPVIHVRHNSKTGGDINKIVLPLPGEKIISKDDVNCFKGTDLLDYLKTLNTDTLVICGMQTHMCVEAATRAASDYGYKCILIYDACATKDLKFNDKVIKSEDVHFSTLSTLRSYSIILSTEDYLSRKYK